MAAYFNMGADIVNNVGSSVVPLSDLVGGFDQRNVYDEGDQMLQAQANTAPIQMALMKAYAPQLNQLYSNMYGNQFASVMPQIVNSMAGSMPAINKMNADSQSYMRQADVNDLRNLGPQWINAARRGNLATTGLVDTLSRQAQTDLNAGSSLTPDMQREYAQNLRTSQAARGMALGPAAAYQEMATLGSAGQALKMQRQQAAANVIGLQNQAFGSPWMALAGRSVAPSTDNMFGAAGNAASQGAGNVFGNLSNMFNPWSQYGSNLYGQNMGNVNSTINNWSTNMARMSNNSSISNNSNNSVSSFF